MIQNRPTNRFPVKRPAAAVHVRAQANRTIGDQRSFQTTPHEDAPRKTAIEQMNVPIPLVRLLKPPHEDGGIKEKGEQEKQQPPLVESRQTQSATIQITRHCALF